MGMGRKRREGTAQVCGKVFFGEGSREGRDGAGTQDERGAWGGDGEKVLWEERRGGGEERRRGSRTGRRREEGRDEKRARGEERRRGVKEGERRRRGKVNELKEKERYLGKGRR